MAYTLVTYLGMRKYLASRKGGNSDLDKGAFDYLEKRKGQMAKKMKHKVSTKTTFDHLGDLVKEGKIK